MNDCALFYFFVFVFFPCSIFITFQVMLHCTCLYAQNRYDEIEPNLRLTEECKWQPWGKTDYSAAAVPKSDSCDPVPFWIKVQHTGVKYRFKMYRRKEDE